VSLTSHWVVGQSIGNYTVTAKLGEGGMGEVFAAEHPRISRQVAIKLLRPQMSVDHDLVERFFDEARAANLIPHPGIIEVFDCGFFEGRAYMIMERLEGESLSAWLRHMRPPGADLATVVALGAQIASALAAAHRNGVVHRDLKPDNIYLLPDNEIAPGLRVKILDFGVAKLLVDPGPSRTDSGMMLGTPIYMSPEQCSGSRQVDHRADIYALGCILFELICCRPPFLQPGAGDLISDHLTTPPPDPARTRPDLPAWLCALILRMLSKRPEERPPSMADVEDRLRAGGLLSTPTPAHAATRMGIGPAPSHSMIDAGTTQRRTSRGRWLVVGVAALGIGGALLVRQARQAQDSPPPVQPTVPLAAPAVLPPPPPDAQAADAQPTVDAPRAPPRPAAKPPRKPPVKPRPRPGEKPFDGFDEL
jgi:serine/threonine protein kinase